MKQNRTAVPQPPRTPQFPQFSRSLCIFLHTSPCEESPAPAPRRSLCDREKKPAPAPRQRLCVLRVLRVRYLLRFPAALSHALRVPERGRLVRPVRAAPESHTDSTDSTDAVEPASGAMVSHGWHGFPTDAAAPLAPRTPQFPRFSRSLCFSPGAQGMLAVLSFVWPLSGRGRSPSGPPGGRALPNLAAIHFLETALSVSLGGVVRLAQHLAIRLVCRAAL